MENLEKDNEVYLITASEAQALVKQGYKEAMQWLGDAVERFPESDPKHVIATANNIVASEKVFKDLPVEHFASVSVETLPMIDEESIRIGGKVVNVVSPELIDAYTESFKEDQKEAWAEAETNGWHTIEEKTTEVVEEPNEKETDKYNDNNPQGAAEASIFDELSAKYFSGETVEEIENQPSNLIDAIESEIENIDAGMSNTEDKNTVDDIYNSTSIFDSLMAKYSLDASDAKDGTIIENEVSVEETMEPEALVELEINESSDDNILENIEKLQDDETSATENSEEPVESSIYDSLAEQYGLNDIEDFGVETPSNASKEVEVENAASDLEEIGYNYTTEDSALIYESSDNSGVEEKPVEDSEEVEPVAEEVALEEETSTEEMTTVEETAEATVEMEEVEPVAEEVALEEETIQAYKMAEETSTEGINPVVIEEYFGASSEETPYQDVINEPVSIDIKDFAEEEEEEELVEQESDSNKPLSIDGPAPGVELSLAGGNNFDDNYGEEPVPVVMRDGITSNNLSLVLNRYEYGEEDENIENGEIVFDKAYTGDESGGLINNTMKSQNLEGLAKAQSEMGSETNLDLKSAEYNLGDEYVSITENIIQKEAESNPEVAESFGGNTNIVLPSVSYETEGDIIEALPAPDVEIEVAEQLESGKKKRKNKSGIIENEMFVPSSEINEEELKQYASNEGITREDRKISVTNDSGIVIQNIIEEPTYNVNEGQLDAPLPEGAGKYVSSNDDEDIIPTINDEDDADESNIKPNINSRQLIQDVKILDSLD